MVQRKRIKEILSGYDREEIVLATACSHSSLQIFHGAKKEGFKTIGIAIGKQPKFYDAFPLAKPDEFLVVDKWKDIPALADELTERNVILVPHGSFVEYLGSDNFANLEIPTFGNRDVLAWESDRMKQREWLISAGIDMPKLIEDAKEIDRPVMVKYHGAKGGRGFFIAKDYLEFKMGIDYSQKYTIQEYILGTRYYLHFFYSPLKKEGYKTGEGALELLSMDRRDESNIDEMYKLGAQEELKRLGIVPSFVVTGNIPVVLRESLLPKVFEMGEKVVEKSIELFGGMVGPFCLETIVTDKLEFKVFEVSSRIVAGTNPFITGSPYADFIEPELSTGRRIAKELKLGAKTNALDKIIT